MGVRTIYFLGGVWAFFLDFSISSSSSSSFLFFFGGGGGGEG